MSRKWRQGRANGRRLRGGSSSATPPPRRLGADEDAREHSVGVEAGAAGGRTVGAQDEEGGEAGDRVLLQRLVDLVRRRRRREVARPSA